MVGTGIAILAHVGERHRRAVVAVVGACGQFSGKWLSGRF
jgi:hypothetical protein